MKKVVKIALFVVAAVFAIAVMISFSNVNFGWALRMALVQIAAVAVATAVLTVISLISQNAYGYFSSSAKVVGTIVLVIGAVINIAGVAVREITPDHTYKFYEDLPAVLHYVKNVSVMEWIGVFGVLVGLSMVITYMILHPDIDEE